MKKTSWIYLKNTIRKNAVSFFAVAFIAAVSIAIYLGIQSASCAIFKDADSYFRSNKLANIEISCGNGITEDDIAALSQHEEIDHAEGGYSSIVTMELEREIITLNALSACEGINMPELLHGEFPKNPNEIAIEQKMADERMLSVGDTVELRHGGSLLSDTDVYIITAVINHPAYCCGIVKDARGIGKEGLGSADYYIVLSKNAFSKAFFNNTYTNAYVMSSDLSNIYYYSGKYERMEKQMLENIKPFAEKRARLRYETLLYEAQGAIAAGLISSSDIAEKEWVVSVRDRMGDLQSVRGLVESVNGISYAMSLIFLLTAVVICYSAVSRIIDEQKILVGTQKAMGFTSNEILKHYMIYSLICAGLGIILGCIIGVGIIEVIVVGIFSSKLLIGSIPIAFAWKEAACAMVLCIAVFLATAYAACRKLTRLSAAQLLRGEAPIKGKGYFFESFSIYKKLSLYSRTMIKNVLDDPGRMISTIVGVIGCVSLLIICLSLKFAIDGAFEKHFEEYFLYENRLIINSSISSASDFERVLQEQDIPYAVVGDKLKAFRAKDGRWMSGRIVTTESPEQLEKFMVTRECGTGDNIPVSENGLLVSRKCAEIYGLTSGSTVEFTDNYGNIRELEIVGVIEHYLQYHLFVTTNAYYEKSMGESADSNVFLLKGNIENLYENVRPMKGFMSLDDNSDMAEDTDAIYMAIGVFLALSVAMALLVLLNQLVMYINRKSRELAVMRINGYTLRETKAYIYKDNIILTLLGLILGSGVGMGLSYVVIKIMEREPSSYVFTPNIKAYLLSWLAGSLFALGVNLIALRKVDALNLTNINGN